MAYYSISYIHTRRKGPGKQLDMDQDRTKTKTMGRSAQVLQSISINDDLKMELKEKDKEMLKLLVGSQKLSYMLLNQKSSLFKLRLGGEHHQGDFNKPPSFVKASSITSTHKEKDAPKKLVPNNLRTKATKDKVSTSKPHPSSTKEKELPTYHYFRKQGHFEARCNERYGVYLQMSKWIRK